MTSVPTDAKLDHLYFNPFRFILEGVDLFLVVQNDLLVLSKEEVQLVL